MQFSEFSFHADLQKGIEAMGFAECTPVQVGAFRHFFDGKDIYGQSQTGTGKTAAFLIAGMQRLLDLGGTLSPEDPKPQLLALAPTRELAVQIAEEAAKLAQFLPFKIGCFYGGVGYEAQEKLLRDGVDLIIGTPGRLIDFHKSKKLPFDRVSVLVIDEADRMFDMGFIDDIRMVLRDMPPREKRFTMLFSATLNSRVGNLTWEYMNEVGDIVIDPEKKTVDQISQELYHVSSGEKMGLLLGLLGREDPPNAIIFVNTKDEAYRLSKRLDANGLQVRTLMGNIPQKDRLKVVNGLKEGKLQYVVATDVAARGLHIDDLALVINYDLPDDEENYIHRIGRTARAGKSGKAISLACEKFVFNLSAIERLLDSKIPVMWADEQLIAEDKSAGQRFAPPKRERDRDRDSGRNYGDRKRDSGRGSGDRQRTGRFEEKPDGRRRPERGAAFGAGGGERNRRRPDNRSGEYRPVDKTSRLSEKRVRAPERVRTPERAPRAERPDSYGKTPRTSKKNQSVEDRLAMYRQKYGENFSAGGSGTDTDTKKTAADGTSGKRRRNRRRRTAGEREIRNPAATGKSQPQKAQNRKEKSAVPASKPEKGILGRLKGLFGKK